MTVRALTATGLTSGLRGRLRCPEFVVRAHGATARLPCGGCA
jgi:hypothetical protein